MSKRIELLNLFKKQTGKSALNNIGAPDDRGQAALHRKIGYQTSNLREYYR